MKADMQLYREGDTTLVDARKPRGVGLLAGRRTCKSIPSCRRKLARMGASDAYIRCHILVVDA